jgi:type I restriction enzyme, R subunit
MEKIGTSSLCSPNFQFLVDIDEGLLAPAIQAERFLCEDPSVAIAKLRLFAERAAKVVAAHLGIYVDEREEFVETLRTLSYHRVFDERLSDLFHTLRKDGNQAVHTGYGSVGDALRDLRFAQRIAEWVYRVIRDPAFRAPAFVSPPAPAGVRAIGALTMATKELEAARARIAELEHEAAQARGESVAERTKRYRVNEEKEGLWVELTEARNLVAETAESKKKEADRYEAELTRIKTAAPVADSPAAREKAASALSAALSMEFDEADTRELIDAQLREAGWVANTNSIRYSLGSRPEKGVSKAIAEWPCAEGRRADYALFRGLEVIAVVEAKRASKNVPAVLDQAEVYAKSLSETEGRSAAFAFATNGRPWLAQLKEASGIWFRDIRMATNLARPLEGWYSPEGLSALLKMDMIEAEKKLDDFGFELDFPLRYYQKDAILAAEKAMREGKRAILLAMATGTGKTKTCIALLYRLLASGLFRRALFLVDRNTLGEQAGNAFKETKIRGLRSFADDFGIKELGEGRPDIETRVTISTVQAMVKKLLYSEAGEAPGVDEYDLVVVDECHRGYLLDRELSDDELEFRSYEEYVSKYRRVLEHFDAVRIGLTATPAPQTTDIFGDPVHYYSYRQAVIDGFLIDHRPPISIETRLAKEGIAWKAGDEVPVYRPDRGQIELFRTPDELAFDVTEFNKKVVTREFNRVVCEYLATQIDPQGDAKTLVYCATDIHADIVVEELKKAFAAAYGEVPDEAVKKITGAATEPMTLFRKYKNEKLPNVAVTVDLLTTGIDVPEICNLVFLRRVNSRILYEQMLGRATRLCEDIGKDYFNVYDAVGLYDSMKDFSDMKPVVMKPNISFEQLLREIADSSKLEPAAAVIARRTALDQFKAKFRRKIARMSEEARAAFEAKTGQSPEEFAERIVSGSIDEAATLLGKVEGLGSWLDRTGTGITRPLPISEHPDELLSVHHKYFIADTAEDYLEQFKAYIESHENEIAALRAVTTKPASLTRKDLKALLITLDEAGFAESTLREAWRDATNADVAASVIGYIRRQALGDPLVPWERRVDEALARLRATRFFTPPQLTWLERIAKQLKAELVVDRSVLDSGVFRDAGGFDRINKVFGGSLERTIEELSELMWRSPA